MVKSKNLRKVKFINRLKTVYIILFALFSTLGFFPLFKVLVYHSVTDGLLFVVYAIVLFFFYGYFRRRISGLQNEIYKITFMNGQVTFYTPSFVYITRNKECVEIIVKKYECIFKFEKGIMLKYKTRQNNFYITKKHRDGKERINIDDLNKSNFPQAKITITKK